MSGDRESTLPRKEASSSADAEEQASRELLRQG